MRFQISGLRTGGALLAFVAVSACGSVDSDFRGAAGGFTTAGVTDRALVARPNPDNRGLITYPNYQVAVAQRGDTVGDIAARIGADAGSLARFNGLPVDTPLRNGEVIVLPQSAAGERSGAVDVTALAGRALDASSAATPRTTTTTLPPQPAAEEPQRHRVAQGETIYTIARSYGVSVEALSDWNGLGADNSIREGQILLVPVARRQTAAAAPLSMPSAPGQGSPTPTPPSAATPLPQDTTPAAAAPQPAAPKPDLGPQTQPAPAGRFAFPVQGSVIREYAKGRNEGIDIKGAPGDPVKAAEAGTVAAITESGEGVPIIVVRHRDNLLTVYANVTDVVVSKGDQVRRGQALAKLRAGDQSFVHFEVREGFDSVDPNSYLTPS